MKKIDHVPLIHWNLGKIVSDLRTFRIQRNRSNNYLKNESNIRRFPSKQNLIYLIKKFCIALFPMQFGSVNLREEIEDFYIGNTISIALNGLLKQILLELQYSSQNQFKSFSKLKKHAIEMVQQFGTELPKIREILELDIIAAYQGDPAAINADEILLCYPGVKALIYHRIAHILYELGIFMLARIIAEIAHSETGIDIHPGAKIGHSFFIDHGTGVVIGETSIIGNRVRLYQMVTLGAKYFPIGQNGELKKGLLRHPIIEDDVIIYAGSTILGRITIGKGSIVGGNVWLTYSIPPGSKITQNKAINNRSDLHSILQKFY